MSIPERKLGFYNLYLHDNDSKDKRKGIFDRALFIKLLDYIASLEDGEKLENDGATKKVYSLKSVSNTDEKIVKLIFNSGKYGHTPDYFSSTNGSTRKHIKIWMKQRRS